MLARPFVLGFVMIAALANGCGAGQPAPGPSTFVPADVEPFVAAHNAVRAAAAPAPSPALPELTWDDSVARVAQAWAERCVFEHSGGALGENLAYFSGDASTPQDVVDIWSAEAADYDYASDSCTPGAQCGHYTQLVWRTTTAVGCGSAACNMLGADGTFWVCNYDPPGNFIGERPY